jgi:cold shock CspA family protein
MPSGIIVHWNSERGYGFANNYAGGPSIFLHISAFSEFVQSEGIRPGMKIEFEIVPQPGHKTKAANVRILELVDIQPRPDVKSERLIRQG